MTKLPHHGSFGLVLALLVGCSNDESHETPTDGASNSSAAGHGALGTAIGPTSTALGGAGGFVSPIAALGGSATFTGIAGRGGTAELTTYGGSNTPGSTLASSSGGAEAGGVSPLGGTSGLSAGGIPSAGGDPSSIAGAQSAAGMAAAGRAALAGDAGIAGAKVDGALSIETGSLPNARVSKPYVATITASGATHYTWQVESGALPVGVSLQDTDTSSVQLTGTPTEVGQFKFALSVTDSTRTAVVELSLAVTKRVAFMADIDQANLEELYLTEVGTAEPVAPVKLNSPITSGNVTRFDWSPDGSKIAYLADSRLYVVAVETPQSAYEIPGAVVNGYVWLSRSDAILLTRGSNNFPQIVDVSTLPPRAPAAVTMPLTDASCRANPSARPDQNGALMLCLKAGSSGFSLIYVNGFNLAAPLADEIWSGTPPPTTQFVNGSLAIYQPSGTFLLQSSGTLPSLSLECNGFSLGPLGQLVTGERGANAGLARHTVTYEPRTSTKHWVTTMLTTTSCATPGQWSPDSAYVLFTCGSDLRGIGSNAVTDTDFSLVPADFFSNSFTNISNYGWSENAQWVALAADRFTADVPELFLLPWSTTPTLSARTYSKIRAPGITAWQFAPDSSFVAYVGAIEGALVPQLFVSALAVGGAPSAAVAATPLAAPAVRNDIQWLPGSRLLLYRSNDVGGMQLHAVRISEDGTVSTSVSLSGPVKAFGVDSYQLSP